MESKKISFIVKEKGTAIYVDPTNEQDVKGPRFCFLFKIGKDNLGMWTVLVKDRLAITKGLYVEEEWRGRGYGQEIVTSVLKYIYENFGVREVHTLISENKRFTSSFPLVRNMLIKVGYGVKTIVQIEDFGPAPFYDLVLDEESYKRFLLTGPKQLSREEVEKIWQAQLKKVTKEKIYKKR